MDLRVVSTGAADGYLRSVVPSYDLFNGCAVKLVASNGKPFILEHTIDGRFDIVVLKHDHGPRVSAYYAELLRTMFESLGSSVKTEETDGQVLATIIRPSTSPIER